jgi:hypothetical protein
MKALIFTSDKDLIERIVNTQPADDVRKNTLMVKRGDYFKEDGMLVYEPWLASIDEFDPILETEQTRNEFDTGDPDISYDDLCRYQAEFEATNGVPDGFPNDAETIQYQLDLVQYCIDRAHGTHH